MSRFLGQILRFAVIAGALVQTSRSWAGTPNAAQTTPTEDAAPNSAPDTAPLLTAKRAVPDYDGRGKKAETTEEALLWIPRVLVAPLYLFTEYLVRRPIGAVVSAIERDKVTQRLVYILTIGPKSNIGISPSLYYDYGRQPAVGAYVWWDDAGSKRNVVRGYFATWGEPLITATLADRWELGPGTATSMRVAYTHRTDNLFYGLGPDTTNRTASRFESTTFEGGPTYEQKYFSASAGVRDVRYADGTCCDAPSLFDRLRKGQLPSPPRLLDKGYTSIFQTVNVAFDTRTSRRETGARVGASGAPSFDVSETPGQSWFRYEASATGSWDIAKSGRVLSLGANAMFVDPLLGGARGTPFTELVSLGGAGPMRGFLPGRLVGRSAAVATLDYEWPIWSFLDGAIQGAIGNVFGAGLKGFDLEKMRMSAVFGIRSNSSRDHVFELLTGFGTETFAQGARATSFRLAFGATRGF